jgi:imidazolonepropionase-like amidohydrolase
MRYLVTVFICIPFLLFGQSTKSYLLLPARIFDGEVMQENWAVLIEGERIKAVGPTASLDQTPGVETVRLPGVTLLPGLIEGHSHLFLHPYNETSWNDQVLRESVAERVARATVHARQTLEAGFTTVRDLGTEGAGYVDVGLKTAIEKGIVPGPRMLTTGPAIVATGSYGPKGFAPQVDVPQGADEASGHDEIIRVVRNQIGKGVDLIKVYADYRWGLKNEARATFSLEELQWMVETAKSSGRGVVAHASTPEGMRRAILAGVETIEHGDEGTPEIFKLMVEKGVALCPTLAAGDAVLQYKGWKKGIDSEPESIRQKKNTFTQALKAGVTISAGGDVGVFSHGDNVRELELMVDYGMPALAVLRSATSVNARIFHLYKEFGHIRPGFFADLVGVIGNPEQNISDLRKVKMVMKGGAWVVKP